MGGVAALWLNRLKGYLYVFHSSLKLGTWVVSWMVSWMKVVLQKGGLVHLASEKKKNMYGVPKSMAFLLGYAGWNFY